MNRRYDPDVRWFWSLLVVGCGAPVAAPTRVAQPVAPTPTSELLVEVRPEPYAPPRQPTVIRRGGIVLEQLERGVEETIVLDGRLGRGFEKQTDVAESDFLSRCVRDFVYAQPEPSRRALIAACTQYLTSCDTEGRIVLERPLSFDSRERRARSDVTFTGTLSAQRVELALRVAYCGGESAAPDRITIVADDTTWTSPRLEFERDASSCDVAELPYTRALGRILFDVTDATDAMIRFEGTGVAGELVAGDGIKHELRLVLEALDALNAP